MYSNEKVINKDSVDNLINYWLSSSYFKNVDFFQAGKSFRNNGIRLL